MPLSNPQPGNHGSLPTIYRQNCAWIEDQGAQSERFLFRTPSSDSARLNSVAVSGPCLLSQESRNSASASARNFAAAASANHDERPFPVFKAAARTSSPSSASNEILILSTFIPESYMV